MASLSRDSQVYGLFLDVLKESGTLLTYMQACRLAKAKAKDSGVSASPSHIEDCPALLREDGLSMPLEQALLEAERGAVVKRAVRPYGMKS